MICAAAARKTMKYGNRNGYFGISLFAFLRE